MGIAFKKSYGITGLGRLDARLDGWRFILKQFSNFMENEEWINNMENG